MEGLRIYRPLRATGLRMIAAFEVVKGMISLAACLAMISNRLPALIASILSEMTAAERSWLVIAAGIYALIRFLIGYGLWCYRRWAEWLTAASWTVYLPIEFYAMAQEATRFKGILLSLNVAVVLFLTWNLLSQRATRVLSDKYCVRGIPHL